jgi:hypothetical protein
MNSPGVPPKIPDADGLPYGLRLVGERRHRDTDNAADFVDRSRRRSYNCIVRGVACPTVRCPSCSLALFPSAVMMHVARIG